MAIAIVYSAAKAEEKLPAPLLEAFTKIDTILSDEVKATLKTKDPKQAEADIFGGDINDIINEESYDDLRSQLVARIERKLGFGIRHPDVGRLPMHPEVELFFVPYLVNDPTTQADILLELYMKRLRGLPTEWKKRLIKQRDLNVSMLERSLDYLMGDIQKMDPTVSVPLLKKMRAAIDKAEKKIAEQVAAPDS
ncbi:hypothetical protein HW115_19345 [Verrucomicrobiaceae bacterium N1E253]|uniref:Uncharacterized protein n=1 Tax=Oceaniferula marina TaxID=2748318 RepID=A0A851GJT7_9BACT|nr:hypothetical protein [Oceaniferula marina]NWK57783.1 hypothetical protein [Oceaniferula marina]